MADNQPLAGAIRGTTANGVPFVALPPADGQAAKALVLLWHGADPPRAEEALAGAVPLADVPAWRVYLGLPLCGQRMPEGDPEEVMGRLAEDEITLFFHPVIAGGAAELPEAVADLRTQLGITPDLPLGLFGFSMGGSAALIAVARRALPIRAAVTFGAPLDMRALMDYLSVQFGVTYEWTPERAALAEEISAIHRGSEIAASGTAVLLGMGADDPYPVNGPVVQFAATVNAAGGTVATETLPGVAHGFVDEPGTEAAPQGAEAQAVDRMVSQWFARHLV